MGKKRSNLRSSPKGCNSGNNIIVGNGSSSSGGGGAGSISNHGIHSGLGTQNTNSAGAASSSLAIPATSAASSRLQQQQQPMQSLFQGEYPNVMPSSTTASSTSTAAATAEKWAWLTEMAVAGAAAASSSGGNHTNGITFPGGGGVMMGNNTSGDCGLMTMTTGNSSSGSSNANSAKKMSHHPDAVSAEQYLQSFSQLLASEMGAAYEQSPSGSNSIKEVLSAALKAQQNNANLRISGSGSVVIRGTGSNSSCNDNKTGKKRSSSSSNTTTTTNTAISSNCSGPNNNKDVGKVMNFQQYLKVTADSYQRIYEQEQKARTQHATTNTTPSSSSPTTTTNAVGSGNGSSRTFPTKNTTKNKNASRKKRNQHHTVASAGAPTAPSTAKEKFAPSLAYPTDGTATTNTNFDPINNNYNNNNTPEDLRTLLPIFTELVSLTNKIVTAQENGNVNQVDATTQSCKKVLKDGQAMGVLGVAMKELNKHPPPLSVGIGGGDDYRLMEGQAYVEGGGVAGMNALLQSMTIHGKNFSIGTENFGTGGGGGRSTAAMSKEELERRRTSIQAAQNEAIRKMAALGATMQTWQQQQQQHQPNGNASDLERVGEGTGTPVFSFTLGGGEPSATHPKTSTSSMIGPLPPPFLSSAGEVAVPPIPPPPGGWPPSTVQAAAPLGYDYSISPATVSTSTFPAFVDAAHLSGPCLPQIPMPMMSGSDTMNSEEWLEYFDAYLRNHGVKGGLDEFEEFARLSSQGAVITASMTAEGVIMENIAGDAAWHGQHPDPQDRWAPPGLRDKDDAGHLPASFEYDDSRYSSDTTDNVLSEQSRISLAIEEEEQRTKKAAKKRDKKARQKERAKREAEVKAALAAMKKREKVITSWRSRVVAACSAGDARKMDALVGESPFKHYVYDPKSLCFDEAEEEDDDDGNEKHDDMPKSQEEYLLKQMEWFLSNCLQKYPCPPSSSSTELTSTQAQPFAQNVAREKLANYILSVSFDIVLHQSPSSQNRNAIHLAAYMGDVDFIQWVIRSQSSRTGNDVSYLECMCLDGGWSPLHYATAGGAKKVVELLLQEGVCVTMRTDSSLTCFKRCVYIGR